MYFSEINRLRCSFLQLGCLQSKYNGRKWQILTYVDLCENISQTVSNTATVTIGLVTIIRKWHIVDLHRFLW